MRFLACLVAVGSLASAAAAAVPHPLFFELSDAVLFDKRQGDDPATKCHENCGYTILNAKKDGYCKDPDWSSLLERCLACALKYDNIWASYGAKVSEAAKTCGLDATPVSPDGHYPASSGPSSAAVTKVPDPSSSGAAQPTVSAEHGSPQSPGVSADSTTTQTVASSTVQSATSGVAPTASVPAISGSPTSTSTTASPPSSSTTVSRGSRTMLSGTLIAGVAVLFAAAAF